MKKALNKATYLSISMVALFLGLMIALQIRTSTSVEQGISADRVQELTIEKKQVERDLDQLREESVDLQLKLEEAGKSHTAATGALEDELFKNKLYGGLVPVEGEGVEVLLSNREGSYYNIKDDDLLKVLNDLRGAGAEAIAVNDQRILATSEARLAGSHINVNTTRLSPPYRVVAIGPSDKLKSSLELRGGLQEYLTDLGVLVTVEAKDRVLVPAYTGALRFDHAKPTQR